MRDRSTERATTIERRAIRAAKTAPRGWSADLAPLVVRPRIRTEQETHQ